jgi:hypothetical protein
MTTNWATKLKADVQAMTKDERRAYAKKRGLTEREINMYERRKERRATNGGR